MDIHHYFDIFFEGIKWYVKVDMPKKTSFPNFSWFVVWFAELCLIICILSLHRLQCCIFSWIREKLKHSAILLLSNCPGNSAFAVFFFHAWVYPLNIVKVRYDKLGLCLLKMIGEWVTYRIRLNPCPVLFLFVCFCLFVLFWVFCNTSSKRGGALFLSVEKVWYSKTVYPVRFSEIYFSLFLYCTSGRYWLLIRILISSFLA